MRTITKLVPLILFAGVVVQACSFTTPDDIANQVPVKGVIRGTVTYVGQPPCSQNGHILGNAVILVFDRRNPPPPGGLGTTAANFGVVSGDNLFANWPVTSGSTKVCPDASYPPMTVSAPFVVAPMDPGSYALEAFFDYTGDFFATFKFRQLPEATDVGGGAIDLNDANSLKPDFSATPIQGPNNTQVYPLIPKQQDPNFVPKFLNVDVGTPGAVPAGSLRGVPDFTMPPNGYVADNVSVFIGSTLKLARPYFYPEGFNGPEGSNNAAVKIAADAPSSDLRPSSTGATPTAYVTGQNPAANPDFVPVLSFPQDMTIFAQPVSPLAIANQRVINDYQAAFPQLKLIAGLPQVERQVGGDVSNPADPFHMQLGLGTAGSAPGGLPGIFVWQDGTHTDQDCVGLANCTPQALNTVPENPLIPKMWPLIVLAKLNDLPASTNPPDPNDPESLIPQGTDLTKPIVIIQGITIADDSLFYTALGQTCVSTDATGHDGCASPTNPNHTTGSILSYPDAVARSNLQDHVTVLLRPSVVCLDPRHPDRGGVVVATGKSISSKGTIDGPYPPSDNKDTGTGQVVNSSILSNPQLSKIVNTSYPGSTNGLMVGCLPPGRYAVNMAYPTGQAWTTPNEIGSCAAAEGQALTGTATALVNPGKCQDKPRPVLYSQGTRAVVEITAVDPDPNKNPNCKSTTVDGNAIPAVPTACTTLPAE